VVGEAAQLGHGVVADTGLLPRVELTSLLEGLWIHVADPGVLAYVLRVAGLGRKAGSTWSAAPGRCDR
jgi:hypothetical protein